MVNFVKQGKNFAIICYVREAFCDYQSDSILLLLQTPLNGRMAAVVHSLRGHWTSIMAKSTSSLHRGEYEVKFFLMPDVVKIQDRDRSETGSCDP